MTRLRRSGRAAVPTLEVRPELLVEAKGSTRISVCIPARDEAATIGPIVTDVRRGLQDRLGLVDEVLVLDHDSTDSTAALARACGARVVAASSVLPGFGPALGKGDVLWRSVHASIGDLIVWIDADVSSFTTDYITRLVAPLIASPGITMVKGTYQRTINGRHSGGGRVTELTAKPALRLLQPHLSHIQQPLAGEYAIRRSAAEALPFEIDYGVEVGLLIDVAAEYGVGSIAQANLGSRVHRNRELDELHQQAGQVLRSILARSGQAMSGTVVRPPMAMISEEQRSRAIAS